MFKITRINKTVFGDEKFSTEYRAFRAKPTETEEETNARFERLKAKCVHQFRCCDDDGTIYFWGVATTNDDDRAFQPLEFVGESYGCTYIEYKNETTHNWEML